jgi:predicted DNA-binding transcriptional regulator YafY
MVMRTRSARADGMVGEWLTSAEAAVRLGVSPETARRLAMRGRWQRMPGNDGRTHVRLPEAWRTPPVRTDDALLHALEAHIESLKSENETLKVQLAAAEARAEKPARPNCAQPPPALRRA